MTDSTQSTTADQDPTTPQADPQTTTEPDNPDQPNPNREAARYRTRLREAEAERDALAERLTQLQTSELHRLAGELLAEPADINLTGKELAEFLTPEGWVDHQAVASAAAELLEARPGLAKVQRQPALDPTRGLGGRIRPQPTWAALFHDS